ncbi:MAG: preprotein translocase subunit SecG [Rhodobacteraceae bacterium]|nr:preprotein translocase subunit SecG [Paracoccaceae bacterium]
MENIVLAVHLILALGLIAVVLLQRSEGGGLGMGGGGGGGAVSGRTAATALGRITWFFAIGFMITSLTLTVLAASNVGSSSVIDTLGATSTEDGAEVPLVDPAAILVPNLGALTIPLPVETPSE